MIKVLLVAVCAAAVAVSSASAALDPRDQCKNLPGLQLTVPAGYYQPLIQADGSPFRYCVPIDFSE